MNNGANFQHVTGPLLPYCPSDNSMKKIGIPTSAKNIVYGMKNAPVMQKMLLTVTAITINKGVRQEQHHYSDTTAAR